MSKLTIEEKKRKVAERCGVVIFIPLTQGFVAVADFDDFEHLRQFKWRTKRNGRTTYAISDSKRYRAWMHKEVLRKPNGRLVQHKDDNGLNNCKSNLFESCDLHNQQIKRKALKASSKYKGVSWISRDKKWQAQIRIKGKSTYLGRFCEEEQGAKAYDNAAKKYFKKFARLNFPNGTTI